MENLLGIGSFAYRYQVGNTWFRPQAPLDAFGVADDAASMGLLRIQLCENLKYLDYPADKLQRLAKYLKDKGMSVELGMYGATYDNLMRHVELAGMFDAEMIRIAVGAENEGYDTDCGHLAETFRHVLRGCDDKLTFGIENHFDITTEEIVKVVELVDDRRLGTVFDTTNAIHLLERPEETLAKMLPYVKSVHLQDFRMETGEASITMNGTIWGLGMLDTNRILKTVAEKCPHASMIVELTVRRDTDAAPEEVIRAEKHQIHSSVENLKNQLRLFYKAPSSALCS